MAEGPVPSPYKMFCGQCPDQQCRATLFFPAHDSNIECTSCGQRHGKNMIQNIAEVTNPEIVIHNLLKNILVGAMKPKKCSDTVKVLGISNYQCKMLSPLLTIYGMEKQSGEAKLLTELGQPKKFDCGVLADRAFLIEPDHMEIVGYGRDKTGSIYLKNTIAAIQSYNDNEERLLPIHADGDGHCLVHAVSRALIGRELFWHALRENLQEHFIQRLDTYKALFCDFVDKDEWGEIIAECDPTYMPADGEMMGLRNIHIYGLANVLRRPIILLDSVSGINNVGDYSGIFLPGLVPEEKCRGKDGVPHKPLCLAWSSSGRNHYIALVAVKGRPLPKLPPRLTPKTWFHSQQDTAKYIAFDADRALTISGDKCLNDRYILRLVTAMEKVFVEKHGVSTAVVADVHQYVYKSTGMVGTQPEVVIAQTQRAVRDHVLYRCLTCDALTEWKVPQEWLRPGGSLYKLAVSSHGALDPAKNYSFPMQGLICGYDKDKDMLEPIMEKSKLALCQWCQGTTLRRVKADGSPEYENGDRTSERATNSRCHCGYKHYWDGQLYDNKPEEIVVPLEWSGRAVTETVAWFQYESDPALNSNVYDVAHKVVQKHFPGEFGSERLVQKVVDTILLFTQTPVSMDTEPSQPNQSQPTFDQATPTKIILTGQQHQSVHKEELVKSKAEKGIREKIESKAPQQQKRKTDELRKEAESSPRDSIEKPKPSGATVKHQKTLESSVIPDSQPSTSAAAAQGQSQSQGQPAKDTEGDRKNKPMKVKVTTTDSRQLMLTLPCRATFTCLMDKLTTELGVSADRLKVKCGFPPKLLQASAEGEAEAVLPIQHGDRLSVEILPDPNAPQAKVPEHLWPAQQDPVSDRWSHFDAVTRETSAQHMLRSLQQLQDSKSDSIDTSIASLVLMATLQNRDPWTMVQTMPHLFSVGGLFYEQVKKDVGLTDAKHYTLPALPGKVFRYSVADERLELCLEPHGHYAIEPGIESRVMNTSLITMAHRQGVFPRDGAASHVIPRELGAGSSGVVVGRAEKMVGKPQVFQGQGHSLKSGSSIEVEAHMPKEMSPTRKKRATRFRKISSGSRQDSIEEMDESEIPDDISNPSVSEDGGHSAQTTSSANRDSASAADRDLVSEMISLANSLTHAEGDSFVNPMRTEDTSQSHITMATNSDETRKEPAFRKVGPGYTVLDSYGTGGNGNGHKAGVASGNGASLGRTPSEEFHKLTRNLEALVEGNEDDLEAPAIEIQEKVNETKDSEETSEQVNTVSEEMDEG